MGAINQRINVTLLSQLAPLCDHLVLGGQVDNPEVMALSRRYSSVSLLGEVPSHKLAQVISAFDICLIPYLISDFTKAIYPSKLMDYLATGKPVIASPLPELIPFSELVYIIDNKVELKSIVDTAWHESEDIRKKRRQVAAQNSWQKRAEAFIELL